MCTDACVESRLGVVVCGGGEGGGGKVWRAGWLVGGKLGQSGGQFEWLAR